MADEYVYKISSRYPQKWLRYDIKHVKNKTCVPSVAEWSKALESDASAGGESPVRAPVRAATLCPYA